MSVVVLNTPGTTTPSSRNTPGKTTPNSRSRAVDALISAKKAQLLSAKAKNDELYNTLAKHAEARSAQKAREHARHSSEKRRLVEGSISARSPEKQLEFKAQDDYAALERARQLEATVLTTMQEQMNDLRTAQESSTEEIKEQMSALDEKLAQSLDQRIRLALEGGGSGSRRGSPSGASPSHRGSSPSHRASLSDRLDAMGAKMTLREGDLRAVAGEVIDLEARFDATMKQVTAGLEGEVQRLSGDVLGRQETTDGLLKHHSDRLARLEELVATSVTDDLRCLRQAGDVMAVRLDGVCAQARAQAEGLASQAASHRALSEEVDRSDARFGAKISAHVDKMMETLTEQFVAQFGRLSERFAAVETTAQEVTQLRGDVAAAVDAIHPLSSRTKFLLMMSVWVGVLAYAFRYLTPDAATRVVPDRVVY